VQWIEDGRFVIANEGDWKGGSLRDQQRATQFFALGKLQIAPR